ncbi:MAG: molybdopterin-guanine dinucleotide biosynthesis protein B [Candidatus Thorarchaeota archaeon]|nr:MAG: molybdopterin-guanine dinucleotide biosynthesis protein B [Candidatus Thorarchaeota archaeon]
MMRIFLISGYSSTGKTTLIERLVPVLIERGHKVATIKSANEDVSPKSGTDTWKHANAGADPAILLGPNSTIIQHSRRLQLETLARQLDVDFILVEGMKQTDLPKLWCIGNASLGDIPKNVRAIVQWEGGVVLRNPPAPILMSDEIDQIASIVEKDAVTVSKLVESD